VPFGDLVLQNLDMFAAFVGNPDIGPEITELDGMSVRELLSEADLVLGGAATPFNPDEMAEVVGSTNMVFDAGFTGTFDKFLAFPASTVPEPSTWAMMFLGFAGLGFVGYRKTRKAVSIAA
jgi:hypothetical protein